MIAYRLLGSHGWTLPSLVLPSLSGDGDCVLEDEA